MNDAIDDQARNASRRQTKTAAEAAVIAEPGIFYFPINVPHPTPWIVSLLPHDFFETTADKKFHGVKASLVHVAQDRVHHAGGHVVRPQACVAIAQGSVNDANLFHDDSPPKGP